MNKLKLKIAMDIILIVIIIAFGYYLHTNLNELIKDPCQVCISKGFNCIKLTMGG